MCIIAVVQKKAKRSDKEMDLVGGPPTEVGVDKSERLYWPLWSDQDV